MVAGELGHYKELLGILHDQVENVTVETGEAVLDILTRLNEIDQLIQDMIAFLNQAGTSETMADLMDRTESRLATNLRLLDEFHSPRDEAAVESREWLGEIQGMVAELHRVVGQVRIISKQTNMLAFNAAIEATRACQFGKEPWWLPKSKKETTCTRNKGLSSNYFEQHVVACVDGPRIQEEKRKSDRRIDCDHVSGLFYAAHHRWPMCGHRVIAAGA